MKWGGHITRWEGAGFYSSRSLKKKGAFGVPYSGTKKVARRRGVRVAGRSGVGIYACTAAQQRKPVKKQHPQRRLCSTNEDRKKGEDLQPW